MRCDFRNGLHNWHKSYTARGNWNETPWDLIWAAQYNELSEVNNDASPATQDGLITLLRTWTLSNSWHIGLLFIYVIRKRSFVSLSAQGSPIALVSGPATTLVGLASNSTKTILNGSLFFHVLLNLCQSMIKSHIVTCTAALPNSIAHVNRKVR